MALSSAQVGGNVHACLVHTMGRKIRLYEAKARAADEVLAARLRAHSKAETAPKLVETYSDFDHVYSAGIERYRGLALRMPERWRCRLRSHATERRFLDLVKYTFARYPVAQHLESAWIEDVRAGANRPAVRVERREPAADNPDFRRWYIIATQGGSLYKRAASDFMSKLETHHFLNAPDALTSPRRACWYAFARVHTPHTNVAARIAQTTLNAFSIASPFWRDVARYFARYPMKIPEMNDLIDFIRAAKEEDEDFTLQGRSIEALRRRVVAWHRMLRQSALVCGGAWEGHPLPDVEYQTGGEQNRAIWNFRQIKTGNELFQEGRRMHHCVVTYKSFCVRGAISIWSLTCEYPRGKINRGVTLELRNDGAIVQCRGFGNRLPYTNEVSVVKRWAIDYGLTWQAIER
jgi:hypothetical protein